MAQGAERGADRLGQALVFGSAVAWSTAGLFTRLIGLDTATMLLWRGIWGALGLLAVGLAFDGRAALSGFRRLGGPGWAYALVSAGGMICFIAALGHTSVAHVAVIYATVPFLAAGLGWMALGERPSRAALVASGVALVGTGVMVGFGADGTIFGDFLAFLMTLGMAVMMILARRWPAIPTRPAAALSAALSVVAVLPFASLALPGPASMGLLALFGLVNSALGLTLFILGSRRIPAVETALIGALDAPLAPLWILLFFGDLPGQATIVGGGIVLVAVVGHILYEARPRPRR